MSNLEPPDEHHLRSARGWLGLGNHLESNEELERIRPLHNAHPDVLELRCQIYAGFKNWELCFDIACALAPLVPERSMGWIYRSQALHELNRTMEAFDLLLPVADRFSREWKIPFDLACYCARLRRITDARGWLERAFLLGDSKSLKRMVLDNPVLEPFWGEMGKE
jgi:hypothetical protein